MSVLTAQVDSALGLTLPESLAKEIGIGPNSQVLVRRMGTAIVISVPHAISPLDALLSQVNDDNVHGETDTGPAVGREAL